MCSAGMPCIHPEITSTSACSSVGLHASRFEGTRKERFEASGCCSRTLGSRNSFCESGVPKRRTHSSLVPAGSSRALHFVPFLVASFKDFDHSLLSAGVHGCRTRSVKLKPGVAQARHSSDTNAWADVST